MLTFSAKSVLSIVSILICAVSLSGVGFAQTPEDPYIDLIAPPSLPTEKSLVLNDGWNGNVEEGHNQLIPVDYLKLEVVSPGPRIVQGDQVKFRATFKHAAMNSYDGVFRLVVGIDDNGEGSEIVEDHLGELENFEEFFPGTEYIIETPSFNFDFDTHTRIVNGRPVLNIHTEAFPNWEIIVGGPSEVVEFIDILATYACTSEVVCPPFPVCGDEDIGYFSSFSLPSELAGKHRTTDYAPKTSAAAGCSSW